MECFECATELHEELEDCPTCHELLCLDCAPIHIEAHDDQARSDTENGAFHDERR